jgi:hypothetical protein
MAGYGTRVPSSRWSKLAGRAAAAMALASPIALLAAPPRGPALIEVSSPSPGAEIGLGGFELLVRFPSERAASETFRARLNGADVTDLLTTGENGSFGRLVGLLPGENVLRLEVFGRVPGSERLWFEQVREIRVRMSQPIDLDRG